ncbi:MAG: DUF2029 domain-containing protein [Ruminococcaceae bacterium]|nr:DUF2029 domain-containing protein [Oscillospiraceae bacterium]
MMYNIIVVICKKINIFFKIDYCTCNKTAKGNRMKKTDLKNQLTQNVSYYSLFIIIESCIAIWFVMFNLANNGVPLNTLMLDPPAQLNDYFMHFGYASAPLGSNIYEISNNTVFPPFSYLMYGILARMTGYTAEDPANIRSHYRVGNNLTIYFIFTIICIFLMAYAISLYIKKKGFVSQVVFPCVLIVSYPFAFSTIQRGNSVLVVAVLLSIALVWRNDESKLKRELAMVLIAVCAGLKIYPALFGLLYIKEKRIPEAIRLVFYGAFVFFAPFVFWGGIDGFKMFLSRAFTLNTEVHRCTFSGVFNAAVEKLGGTVNPAVTNIVLQAFLVLSVAAFFVCKEKWGGVLLLASLMAVYVSSGWMYTCIYILPALLMFFAETSGREEKSLVDRLTDILVFVLFIVVFSIPYKLDYMFIYDTIVFIDCIYIVKSITMFVYSFFQKNKA